MASIYQVVWSPVIGEELSIEREHGNPEDAFAVAIMKSGPDDSRIYAASFGAGGLQVVDHQLQ